MHQGFELFGQGGLAAPDRAEQVQNLFFLFQALGGVLEEGDDLLDALFHAVELMEGFVALDDFVGKNAAQPWVQGGVHQLGFANGHQHPFGGGGVNAAVLFTQVQVLLNAQLFLLG